MPQIEGTKRIKRTVKIYGIEGDCYVTLSEQGVEIKAKGSKRGVIASWPELVKAGHEPENVKSRFHRDPYAYLQDQAQLVSKRRTKRLEKKIDQEIKERTK
jgi:hypothetical protein